MNNKDDNLEEFRNNKSKKEELNSIENPKSTKSPQMIRNEEIVIEETEVNAVKQILFDSFEASHNDKNTLTEFTFKLMANDSNLNNYDDFRELTSDTFKLI